MFRREVAVKSHLGFSVSMRVCEHGGWEIKDSRTSSSEWGLLKTAKKWPSFCLLLYPPMMQCDFASYSHQKVPFISSPFEPGLSL